MLENEEDNPSKFLFKSVTHSELAKVIKSLPTGKCASKDNLTYENIEYGGDLLIKCLTKLFNQILLNETVPDDFKNGLTITLHKGSGKSTSDPNNYRAISLLPVISKLFEKTILNRIENNDDIQSKLNSLQHGFQKGKK